MSKRLLISFSGGETSALMSKLIIENMAGEYDEIRTVFANTGEENEETLEFVDKCDRAFGLNVTWIEAVTPPERGVGARCKVVSFETASRNGEPFEEMIRKHGIPNKNTPHCTKEMKTRPITRWAREMGWLPGSYDLAIGIRADEVDRIAEDFRKRRIIYPLISRFPRTKPMVSEFWARQPFRLNLKGYQGNCKWCWKKSLRKHLTILKENPSAYDFPARMEALYPLAGSNPNNEPRVFFREGRSTEDLRKMAATERFTPASDDAREYQIDLLNYLDADMDACGSGESCELVFEEAA